jgi:CPA1 family monovalent cation:H+ antiporter
MLRLRRWVRDTRIEILLSILTPFLAYWPPEHIGGSGVLATVTSGLYISWNGPRLISAATRLQGIFFWDLFIYLIEGLVFLITGLQAHALVLRMPSSSVGELAISVAGICIVVVLTRFIWMYPATYLPRWLIPAIRRKDPSPPWQFPFAIAFTGIRGIVSLAAALAIPLSTASGQAFPGRDLILFLTFSVILVTLIIQGLMLPRVIRFLGLANAGHRERQADGSEERQARKLGIETALATLESLIIDRALPAEISEPLRVRYAERLGHASEPQESERKERNLTETQCDIELLLISAERAHVNELFKAGMLKDEGRRHIERDLDLREAQILNTRNRYV